MNTKTLALYLGCQVSFRDGEEIFTLQNIDISLNAPEVKYKGRSIPVQLLKPIPRPLSSMTEEESQEFLSISWYNKNGKFTKDEIEMFMKPPHHYSTESFLWLLSKGFDLFGLIEKGEALDSTSQPEGNTVNMK